MSYTLDLIVGPLPQDDKQAWQHIETLRESYYDDSREKAPALVELHAVLTARYPCLCSYPDDDPEMDNSPWADGPMIGNFAHEMGMLAISFSRVDEVAPFIIAEANALGISVADGQSAEIHRPGGGAQKQAEKRSWWRFWQ
ncbi:MAG: hypothetical protein ACN6RK_01085 [Stenotrophomonas sp.]